MENQNAKKIIGGLLQSAGITIKASGPADMEVHDDRFYLRVLQDGALGFGEAYMAGWWDSEHIDILAEKILKANLKNKVKNSKHLFLQFLLSKIINFQSKTRALEVGKKHYDLSHQLFSMMLDSQMNYTCGYWKNASTLEQAQQAKLELVCQKLKLKPGMRMLDIGCGWGALAKYAATHFGVDVVGITISEEQAAFAKKNCQGLNVDIRFQDYRDVDEKFDCIASLGMFEHVGYRNYAVYMKKVTHCLDHNGLFLLHTIGANQIGLVNQWITKYIFPNGMIPTISLIAKASEGLLVMEDWHNFGADYDKTLMAWQDNFKKAWPILKSEYSEKFYRMWSYYLLTCAASFRVRDLQLWQIIFSKKGINGGYQAPR